MPRKPAKCGTESGYRRHKRLGEPTCSSCTSAHNQRITQQRAQRSEKKKKEEQAQHEEAIKTIKKSVTYNLEDLDELADLIYQRDTLKDSLEVVKQTEPAKISPLSKELREVHKRINELLKNDVEDEPEGGTLSDLLYPG